MSRLLGSVVFVAGVLLLGSSTATAVILPDVLYYRMEEPPWDGTPNEVVDSSGMNHHGTAAGGATTVSHGVPFGRAGSFNGTSGYVAAGTATTLAPTSAITLEAWVKPEAIRDGPSWKYHHTVLGRRYCHLLQIGIDGSLGMYVNGTGGSTWLTTDPGDLDMNDYLGKWVHVAGTYDTSTQEQVLYVNGDPVADQTGGTTSLRTSTDAHGTRVGHVDYSRFFDGEIDNAGIHSAALTHQQIRQQAKRPDLLELHMDELSWDGTPDEVADSSGMNHHGTAVGNATTVVDSPYGRLGRSGSFDGTGDYVNVGNASTLNPVDEISLEAWIKPDFDNWNHLGAVVARSGAYYLEVDDDGLIRSYYYGAAESWLEGPDLTPYAGQWVHVVGTYDGSEEAIYVNGVKAAWQQATGSLDQSTSDTMVGYVDYSRYFTGLIADAAIYSWALDPQEIYYRYSQVIPEPGSLLVALGLLCCVAAARCRRRRYRDSQIGGTPC